MHAIMKMTTTSSCIIHTAETQVQFRWLRNTGLLRWRSSRITYQACEPRVGDDLLGGALARSAQYFDEVAHCAADPLPTQQSRQQGGRLRLEQGSTIDTPGHTSHYSRKRVIRSRQCCPLTDRILLRSRERLVEARRTAALRNNRGSWLLPCVYMPRRSTSRLR